MCVSGVIWTILFRKKNMAKVVSLRNGCKNNSHQLQKQTFFSEQRLDNWFGLWYISLYFDNTRLASLKKYVFIVFHTASYSIIKKSNYHHIWFQFFSSTNKHFNNINHAGYQSNYILTKVARIHLAHQQSLFLHIFLFNFTYFLKFKLITLIQIQLNEQQKCQDNKTV